MDKLSQQQCAQRLLEMLQRHVNSSNRQAIRDEIALEGLQAEIQAWERLNSEPGLGITNPKHKLAAVQARLEDSRRIYASDLDILEFATQRICELIADS